MCLSFIGSRRITLKVNVNTVNNVFTLDPIIYLFSLQILAFFELLRKFKSETVPTAATCSKIKSSEKFEYAIAHCNGRIQTRRFLVKDQPVIHDFRGRTLSLVDT